MVDIFVSDHSGLTTRWKLLEETSIARFLGDPIRTGTVYLHNPAEPILGEVTDTTSIEQYQAYMNGVHIATNYGLAIFFASGSTHIRPSQGGKKGYIIPQLTDMIFDLEQHPKAGRTAVLNANPLKMSDAGQKYRVDSTFEEVMQELQAHYRFVEPFQGSFLMDWFKEIKQEVIQQRKPKLTDDFVARVNQEYFSLRSRDYPTTKKDMEEHFLNFRW